MRGALHSLEQIRKGYINQGQSSDGSRLVFMHGNSTDIKWFGCIHLELFALGMEGMGCKTTWLLDGDARAMAKPAALRKSLGMPLR